MTKVEMQSSANLINNLLLNLDNLKIQNDSNNIQENLNSNLQDQLEMLKFETQKLTNQYTQNSNKNNKNNKSKKIPPPIITGSYRKKTQFQTIDDLLFELNNVSIKTYGGNQTPVSKSSKGRKNSGSFVDPRRYSDPYKYTILSTLDETEDDEEEESIYTPKTPMTALPFYSRKKNLACNTNLKVPVSHYMSPKSAGLRARSYSQPERCNYKSTMNTHCEENVPSLKCHMEQNDRASTKYLMKLHNSISNEKKNNSPGFVKPPRSSSISKHTYKYSEDYSSSESNSDNEKSNTNGKLGVKRRGTMGLENKSSFQSDITLVNEE
jgi:hypothetical protein